MYNQKKRKIIILSIVISVVVLLLIAGGVYAYVATDLLKSNETLFYKYLGQELEDLKYVPNKQLADVKKLTDEMPFTVEGNLGYEGENKALSNLKLNYEIEMNNEEEEQYAKLSLANKLENIFEIEYAKSNNIYALKSAEIVNAFVGIENDNLKVLAQKLGIADTTNIPDQINDNYNIEKTITLTDSEKEHIKETYIKIITDNINSKNYTKERDLSAVKDGVTYNNIIAYRLKLTGEELRKIEVAMLENLKQDSVTLNIIATKAKEKELSEEYTSVNQLTKTIDKLIEEINEREIDSSEGISIMVYVSGGKTITTEIIINNQYKLTINGTSKDNLSNRYLLFENFDVESDYSTIEITEQETRGTDESTYNIDVNIGKEQKYNLNIENVGSANQNRLTTTIQLSDQDEKNVLKLEQEIVFDDEIKIIKLDRKTNCGVLNDYSKDQLNTLIQALAERIQVVYQQKMEKLGELINTKTSTQNIIQPKEVEQLKTNNNL